MEGNKIVYETVDEYITLHHDIACYEIGNFFR
jgi:hypothetical protein